MDERDRISLDEQTARGLLDQMVTGIFILADEHVRWANRALLELLDYDLDELTREPAWRIVHPADRDKVRQMALERVAGMRQREVYETRLVRRDGNPLWAEIRATPINFQNVPAVLTNVVDISDRKQAEQALSESEQRFRTFFENAPIGIYRTSPDGRLLLVNPALRRMLGHASDQAGLHRQAFEPTFPHSDFKRRIDRDGEVFGLESAWIRSDDSLLYVRENASAVLDDDGRVRYYEGTVENITRQKQANQALALYAQRLQVRQEVDRAILTARSPEEIVQAVVTRIRRMVPCDRATVILTDVERDTARIFATATSAAFQDLHDAGTVLPLSDVIVKALLAAPERFYNIPDIDRMDERPAALERLRALGIRSCLTVPLLVEERLAGTLNLSSSQPAAFDAEQQKIALALADHLSIALHQDRLRSQLADERNRMRTLIEHLPEGVLLLDADRRLALANPAARAHLAALGLEDSDELPERLGCARAATDQPALDFEISTPGADRRDFEVACRPIPAGEVVPGAAAEPGGWAIVLRDVTEQRRVQQQLRLQERQAGIGTLASGVAHDFNNLLSAISGCAWLLLRKLPADSPLRKPADDIRATCDRASELTRQLLEYSRSRTGAVQLLNLNGVVDEMGRMLDRLVGSSIRVQLELAIDLEPIRADPVTLEQVLINLVINARDAMRGGGELFIHTLRLEAAAADDSWIDPLTPGCYAVLRVRDTGSGMPAAVQAQAFEPFFTTKAEEGGTGLGLSTVKGIVAEAGGSIRLHSTPNDGTTFELAFPFAAADDGA